MPKSDLEPSSPDVRNNAFLERMNVLAERVGGPGELARRSRLSRRVIDKYRSGESEPNRPRLVALARAGGVSVEWLATGEGSMVPEHRTAPVGDDYIALPRYDVRAAAGGGAIVEAEPVVDWIYFKRDWLRRTLGVSPSELAIIEAVGDSMAPTIDDGDLLLVDVGEPKLRGEGIYVIAVDDALVVKRIAIKLGGGLVISSDNPHYHATHQELTRSELEFLRIIGRVVWVGGRI